MLREVVYQYVYLEVDYCCDLVWVFGHLGVSELCPFEISWGDVRGGGVEESVFGCVGVVFLLADGHHKWPPPHQGGSLFRCWCELELGCGCYPVWGEVVS